MTQILDMCRSHNRDHHLALSLILSIATIKIVTQYDNEDNQGSGNLPASPKRKMPKVSEHTLYVIELVILD